MVSYGGSLEKGGFFYYMNYRMDPELNEAVERIVLRFSPVGPVVIA